MSLVISHRISFVCVAPTTIMWHSSTGHSFRVLAVAVSLCLALLVVSSSGEAELILPSDTCWYGIARARQVAKSRCCACVADAVALSTSGHMASTHSHRRMYERAATRAWHASSRGVGFDAHG